MQIIPANLNENETASASSVCVRQPVATCDDDDSVMSASLVDWIYLDLECERAVGLTQRNTNVDWHLVGDGRKGLSGTETTNQLLYLHEKRTTQHLTFNRTQHAYEPNEDAPFFVWLCGRGRRRYVFISIVKYIFKHELILTLSTHVTFRVNSIWIRYVYKWFFTRGTHTHTNPYCPFEVFIFIYASSANEAMNELSECEEQLFNVKIIINENWFASRKCLIAHPKHMFVVSNFKFDYSEVVWIPIERWELTDWIFLTTDMSSMSHEHVNR